MEKEVTATQQTGALGEGQVSVALMKVGWAPAVKIEQDIGDDLLSFARVTVPKVDEDEAGSSTGTDLFDISMPVILQVKSSPTEYLRTKSRHRSRAGWWYWEDTKGHLDHWTGFGLPYLLVYQDTANGISYWAHVTPQNIDKTPNGRKVFVPADQTITPECLDQLTQAILTQRRNLLTNIQPGRLKALPPGQRLRYALVVPRLAAPHLNRLSNAIESEEAVAMILRGRLADIYHIADSSGCPPVKSWRSHKEWGWRFAGAFLTALDSGDTTALMRLAGKAPSKPERDACRAVAGAVAYANGRTTAALNALSVQPDARPVDRGWVLMLRAHVLYEKGDKHGAHKAAQNAVRCFKVSGDLTADALRVGCLSVVYASADAAPLDFQDGLAAQDNLGTLWRAQAVSDALARDLDDRFRGWAGDKSIRFVSVRAFDLLTLAGWNAAFSGAWGTWRDLLSQASRVCLASSPGSDDVRAALDALVRTGNKSQVKLAAQRVWLNGPLDGLHACAKTLAAGSWPLRSEGATFELLAEAGDLLTAEEADGVIGRIIKLLRTDGTVRRLGNGFSDRLAEVDSTLGRLLYAASDTSHIMCAELVGDLFDDDTGRADAMVRVARSINLSVVPVETLDLLIEVALKRGDHYCVDLLMEVGEVHPPAIAKLRELHESGNAMAARALLVTGEVTPETWRALGKQKLAIVRKMIEDATPKYPNGSVAFGMGGYDHLDDLTRAAFHTGDNRLWKGVTDALAAGVLSGDQIASAVEFIAKHQNQLPPHIQTRLRKIAPTLKPAKTFDSEAGRFTSARFALLSATGHLDSDTTIVGLLGLRATDPRGFARVLQDVPSVHQEGFLIAALVDPEAETRAQAAYSLIRVSKGRPAVATRAATALLAALTMNDGARMPLATAVALTDLDLEQFDDVRTFVAAHPSAVVRSRTP
ncbi:DUF4365 domain-containing protein [Nocardioides panzhihuensis]|uniref:DUF4365 domain-containing protein n=1 Tax=Nocardioides panzhihuensis TaxID=860243 RepID=A0A7Z0DK04_9ACTN|nr:hypothetical protein [Nocardioides panzhihuensis]